MLIGPIFGDTNTLFPSSEEEFHSRIPLGILVPSFRYVREGTGRRPVRLCVPNPRLLPLEGRNEDFFCDLLPNQTRRGVRTGTRSGRWVTGRKRYIYQSLLPRIVLLWSNSTIRVHHSFGVCGTVSPLPKYPTPSPTPTSVDDRIFRSEPRVGS